MLHMTHPDPITRLLTPQEAAEYLGCSKPHIYRLITTGALRAVDISAPGSQKTKTRIRQEDLTEYLMGNVVQIAQ